jgi:hypothetical protein
LRKYPVVLAGMDRLQSQRETAALETPEIAAAAETASTVWLKSRLQIDIFPFPF